MSPFVRPYAVRGSDREAALSVLLILLAVFTATFTGLPDTFESEVDFQTTSALARSGSFTPGGTPEARAIAMDPRGVAAGADGRLDPWSGPGSAIAALPFYALGRGMALIWPSIEERHAAGGTESEYFAHLAVGWRNPLLGALIAYLLVLTARRLGMRRPAAWLAGVAYGTTTFAWAQSRSTLPDVQATFFLFLAFHMIVKARERFERLRAPRNHELMFAGVALGGALLTRLALTPAVAVVAVSGLVVLRVGHRRIGRSFEGWALPRHKTPTFQLLVFLAPLIGAALAFAAFASIGGPRFETALAEWIFRERPSYLGPPGIGLLGLLVSPGRGVLWMAPGVLLIPFGLKAPDGRDLPLWTRTLLGVALACLVPVAFTHNWHGAWTYGPRYLLPVLPFAWLAFGFALEAPGRWLRPAASGLCALGLLVQLPAALVDHTTHQDLAVQAAREAWPDPGGANERERDEARFHLIQWDWRFAAPWAHWRILRHRIAGLAEDFPVEDLFRLDSVEIVTPSDERERGFRHLAWVDLAERLGGFLLLGALLSVLMVGTGVVLALRSLDRTRL